MVNVRKERDRWQLIRDMSSKEMDLCKMNEYEFVKKIVNKDSCAGRFAKILKISDKWKIIVYFKDLKSSIKEGLMEKIWKVRNFREIYRKEKRKKDHKIVRRKTEEVKERAIRKKTMQFLRGHIWTRHHKGLF